MEQQAVATNDPWTPLSPIGLIPGPDMEEEEDFKLGSAKHIAVLETKLAKVKGRSKEPTSKEMIVCLAHAKESHMKHLMSDRVTPYVTDTTMEEDREENAFSMLQRRIQPQKQALTEEELKTLVENDELKKAAGERHEEEEERLALKATEGERLALKATEVERLALKAAEDERLAIKAAEEQRLDALRTDEGKEDTSGEPTKDDEEDSHQQGGQDSEHLQSDPLEKEGTLNEET